MATNTKISTARLSVEHLSENDAPFIQELLNTEGWLKFIGNRNIQSREDAIAYIQKINKNENSTYWTVKLLDTQIAIGVVTVIKRDYLEHKDIGFAFLPKFANKGYAFEASQAVLNYLISQNKISHILAQTLPDNIFSIKLIEKLGLKFEKNIEIDIETFSIYNASVEQILINS